MCSSAIILPREVMMTLMVIKEQHSVEKWNTLAVLEDLGRNCSLQNLHWDNGGVSDDEDHLKILSEIE